MTLHRNNWSRSRFASVALVCLASLVGCGDESAAEAESETGQNDTLALQKPQQPVVLKPNGVYFAEVVADGTGCPAGSWNASISPDGQVFTMTFSAYQIEISPERANATKACALTMKLRSEEEKAFAVLGVYYSGYALLEKGVNARLDVRYGFHGSSADAGNSRNEVTGPADADFVIQDNVGADRQKWSACGKDHTLTASTDLNLKNSNPRANGYINMAAIDSSVKLELRLGWGACRGQQSRPTQADGGSKPGASGAAPGKAR